MKYVSIDIETTGLDPDTCQVLEIGAVIDDMKTPLTQLPTYRYRIKRDIYTGQPYALAMHSHLFADLAELDYGYSNGLNDIVGSESYFARRFAAWLADHEIEIPYTAAGKNFTNFDAHFLCRMSNVSKITPWHHRILDPGSMYARVGDDTVPSMRTCIKRAGINVSRIPGKPHTAIYDALVVCALIRRGIHRSEKD